MIKVVARTAVREECIEAYHTLAKELVAETQKESGNISYTLNQSLENKKLHAMIEVWESREADGDWDESTWSRLRSFLCFAKKCLRLLPQQQNCRARHAILCPSR